MKQFFVENWFIVVVAFCFGYWQMAQAKKYEPYSQPVEVVELR